MHMTDTWQSEPANDEFDFIEKILSINHYVEKVMAIDYCPNKMSAKLILNDNHVLNFQFDCGATINVIPINIYRSLFNNDNMEQVEPSCATQVIFNQKYFEICRTKNTDCYKF